jgi:signal transduction histidine kinase
VAQASRLLCSASSTIALPGGDGQPLVRTAGSNPSDGARLEVPLRVGTETMGQLALSYDGPRRLSDEDVALASTFADQVALVIENARLSQQAQHTAMLEERQRLARELHDAVTQTLFSASLLAEVVPRLWQRDPDEGARRLGELRALTRGALAEMRALLLELRPGALAEIPLDQLLRQLAEAASSRAGLVVHVHGEGLGGRLLPQDVQVGLYRIAQEALNNVAKHAHAEHVEVTLTADAGGVALSVLDDGRGLDPSTIPAGHFGVQIMRERAQAIGAHLELSSRPLGGTRVSVSWPAPAT